MDRLTQSEKRIIKGCVVHHSKHRLWIWWITPAAIPPYELMHRSKKDCYSMTSSARERRRGDAERLHGLEVDHQLVYADF
jgi:hypothetical protein